ncbi:TVP38/TMEM64 family protein [Paenibacillus campi]|uniref:TVP38/TMEM64 family protein n=1 Tax=Paenibacillus campi TaxID=3106031 RepID=UPI002AFDF5FF|nr:MULTISPECIES: TVP38/TMEM64 family protein [unclassified Paenibacillus]
MDMILFTTGVVAAHLDMADWVESYRSFGPLISMIMAFLLSFIPPLPTLAVIGMNAAANGLWYGFICSWIGVMLGIMTVFILVRKLSHWSLIQRIAARKSMRKSLGWIEKNGFWYLFLFSLLPFGPFTVMHAAAGLSGISLRSFLIASATGRAVMIFAVSYIGSDLDNYIEHPWLLLPVVCFLGAGLWLAKQLENWMSKHQKEAAS